MAYRDKDEADLDDREWPDESDQDDEPELINCPYCGSPISEEAEVCPHCHSFVSIEDIPRRRPWWLWLAILAAIVAMMMWVM